MTRVSMASVAQRCKSASGGPTDGRADLALALRDWLPRVICEPRVGQQKKKRSI